MYKPLPKDHKSHCEYDSIITEVIEKKLDEKVMAKALKNAKRESQAEALYVIYRLKEISCNCI